MDLDNAALKGSSQKPQVFTLQPPGDDMSPGCGATLEVTETLFRQAEDRSGIDIFPKFTCDCNHMHASTSPVAALKLKKLLG